MFKIVPYGEKSAIEAALLTNNIKQSSNPKGDKSDFRETIGKIKFDWQIIAIAKVEGASELYTNDEQMRRRARRAGLKVCGIMDIDLPPQKHLPWQYPVSPD